MSGSDGVQADVRSVQDAPSETAMATAAMRALAAHGERDEIRGADHLAELFLTETRKAPLQDPAVRQWVMKNKIAPGAYEFMIARTAFFDHVVRDALVQHVLSWSSWVRDTIRDHTDSEDWPIRRRFSNLTRPRRKPVRKKCYVGNPFRGQTTWCLRPSTLPPTI